MFVGMCPESAVTLEPLEPRQLLAGVTMLIHGHQGSINGWVRAAAEAIAEHVPGGADQASQFTLKVDQLKVVTRLLYRFGAELILVP